MIIQPEEYERHSAYELLKAAAHGSVGIDRRWLRAVIGNPERNLPDIVRFAAGDSDIEPVSLDEDLISIFRYLKAPQGIPFLLEQIRMDVEEIPDEVVEAFVAIGEPAIEPLLQLYEEVGSESGAEIAFLLAGLGVKHPEILKLLLKRLDDGEEEALFHLEVYNDPAATGELRARLEAANPELRQDLEDAITAIESQEAGNLKDEFDIWELYPEEDSPGYDLLTESEKLEFLSSPSVAQRAEAAEAFFGEELSAEAQQKLLEVAKNDPEARVRARAWEAFYDYTEQPQLRRVMMERIADPAVPPEERAGLALGLARHADRPEVREAILALAREPATRAKAIDAMWRSFDPDFGPVALAFISDPDMEVRRSVLWAIGYLNQSKQASLLVPFFQNEELRVDALHNYALAAPGATTKKKMRALFVKIDDLARGLTRGEHQAVVAGIEVRLSREGLEPKFDPQTPEEEDEPAPVEAGKAKKVGRNDACPCGSGKKFKKCCGQ